MVNEKTYLAQKPIICLRMNFGILTYIGAPISIRQIEEREKINSCMELGLLGECSRTSNVLVCVSVQCLLTSVPGQNRIGVFALPHTCHISDLEIPLKLTL